jgi:membrane-bound serine protease (ClpP class)
LLFIAPAMMMGLASWWEVIAILAGVVLLAIEVFVLPGFGIPGILGLLLMMGGLISTFLPQGKGMFNSGFVASGGLNDLLWITLLVIGSLVSGGLLLWFVIKQIGEIPLFRKLVLTGDDEVTSGTLASSAMMGAETFLRVGDEGVTVTRMTPAGRIEIANRLYDAVTEGSLLEAGTQIHVISVDGIRIGVAKGPAPERVREPSEENET